MKIDKTRIKITSIRPKDIKNIPTFYTFDTWSLKNGFEKLGYSIPVVFTVKEDKKTKITSNYVK